ncbi:hypothetical protein [Runella sp.]|uniref:hypothetical protein n=1 Tax=Runella sp. TaxID=1960881 RepID=UPI00301B3A6C
MQTIFDITKLAELSLSELKDFQAAITAAIDLIEAHQSPEKRYAHEIKTVKEGGKIKTTSYYNYNFVKKAKGLRGTWLSGQWVFEQSVEEHVIKAMLDCYSVTGLTPYEVCTLTVKGFSNEVRHSGVELFGRPIAKAWGRDSGAKAQDGIFLIDGKFNSSGSVKNWTTWVRNATFEIHDFPVVALDCADVKEAIEEGWVEVKY